MNEQEITQVMQEYVDNQEMPGGALIVRKNDAIVYDGKWGYANLDTRTPVQDDTIYRMASMTKCVIGVAVMQLVEQGFMHLDDPVSRFIPAFRNLRVANDPLYQKYSPPNILFSFLFLRMDRLKTVAANREVTIRDLLSRDAEIPQPRGYPSAKDRTLHPLRPGFPAGYLHQLFPVRVFRYTGIYP